MYYNRHMTMPLSHLGLLLSITEAGGRATTRQLEERMPRALRPSDYRLWCLRALKLLQKSGLCEGGRGEGFGAPMHWEITAAGSQLMEQQMEALAGLYYDES